MACSERLESIALYAGGDLEPEAAEALQKHLETCEACREELASLRGARRFASDAFQPATPAPDEFLAGVYAARSRIATRRRVRYLAACASAAVILVLLLFGFPGGDEEEKLPQAGPVEVESVGYREASVTVVPTQKESMTVVWIVSREIVTNR